MPDQQPDGQIARRFDPKQRRDGDGKWTDGPSVPGAALAKGAVQAGAGALKSAEIGLFSVRSWGELRTTVTAALPPAISGATPPPIPTPPVPPSGAAAMARVGAKGALAVAGSAIEAYEIGKNWNKDWSKVTFATLGIGLTGASLLAPPAAPFLLGAGLGLEVLSHSKKVNKAVGDFTAPGWEWLDKKVVKPAGKQASHLRGKPRRKPRPVKT